MATCSNCEASNATHNVKIRAEITLADHVEVTAGIIPVCASCFEEACSPVTGITAKLREALVAYGILIKDAGETG